MSKQKKIAIIGSRGIPAEFGGFETFAEQLALKLVNNGMKVTVFCESTQKYSKPEYQGVDLVYIKTPNIVGLRSIWFDLINIIKTLRGYDVVYMLGYHAAFAFILPWACKTNFWVNMDGLEWKRDKWSPFAKKYLKINEYLACIFAKKLIADAQGIADYLDQTYQVANKTVMIPYGADLIDLKPNTDFIHKTGIKPDDYFLIVCRLEPENHVEEMIQGYINSSIQNKLIIVGDHKSGTKYVNKLIAIKDERIQFLGTIFNQEHLMSLRYYCKAYLHGHSVGGTNPSLLEGMAAGNYIIAHDNIFNREVTDENCSYFKNSTDLSIILELYQDNTDVKDIKNRLLKLITTKYNWENIANIYQNEINSKNTDE